MKSMKKKSFGSLGRPRPRLPRYPGLAAAATLCMALLIGLAGCSKATWKQIGDDSRKAMESTGKAIEGAAKGAIEAVEKD
ncbi:MAG TPA: hypothetical protein VK997_15270 [Deferrisomatales bacterium]|nr:hypothetical protein [Deferrisomatales bacterium]